MPYQCDDNAPMYVEKLGIFKAITDELDNTCYAIIGDWNANLCDIDNSLFAGHMMNFCSENKFKFHLVHTYQKDHIHMLVKGIWRKVCSDRVCDRRINAPGHICSGIRIFDDVYIFMAVDI